MNDQEEVEKEELERANFPAEMVFVNCCGAVIKVDSDCHGVQVVV